MPTSPFTDEHDALRSSARRLVADRLAPLADRAERGEQVHAEALDATAQLRGLNDVLADVVVAEELGRVRSGGLTAVLLDAALLADAGIAAAPAALARRGEVRIQGALADGYLPMVVGGAVARTVVVLASHAVIEVSDDCGIDAVAAAHGLRGGALADLSIRGAAATRVEISPSLLRRAELREAAAAVASGWKTFYDAHAYAGQRTAFGRPIGAFQVNRHALAEMATWLTAAEALVHDAAWSMAAGGEGTAAATATARLVAGRTARRVADVCLQLHGGYGYTMDFDVQRAWRDARALAVGDAERQAAILSPRGAAP